MNLIKTTFLSLLLILPITGFSQDSRYFVNSGDLIEKGLKAHDEDKYKEAISFYNQIPESDTNYFQAMYELSLSAIADSQYNIAREAIRNGLARVPNPYEHDLLLQMGNMYDAMGKYDSGAYSFNKCHERFPGSYYPIHAKGINFYKRNLYDSAFNCFQQVVLMNPYAFNSHYFLGALAMQMGYPVQAMLAFSTSLLISPEGGRSKVSIRFLYEMANLTDSVLYKFENRNECGFLKEDYSEIESLLKAKIALDRKYRSKSVIDDNIFKQLNMICEKLPKDKKPTGHFYQDYYGTLFREIFDQDLYNGASMIMISGLEEKGLQKLYKENQKDVNKAITRISSRLDEIGYHRSVEQPVDRKNPGYFFSKGSMIAKGRFEDDDMKIKTGEFTYYNQVGNVVGYRSFEKDKYQGEMKLYSWNGKLSYEGMFEKDQVKGKSNSYYLNGSPERISELDGEKRLNRFALFYPNGNMKEEDSYQNGKLNGLTRSYYDDGGIQYEATNVNGVLEGSLKEFYRNGKLYSIAEVRNGKLNGPIVIYNLDGSIHEKGEAKDNEREGQFTSYFNSGKVMAKESYKKGKLDGNCIYYFENGTERLNMNYSHGDKDGTSTERNDANALVEVVEYKNDHFRKITYYNVLTGKPIHTNEIESKSRNLIKVYNETGVLIKEAICNQDGIYNGEYKEYFPDGQLSLQETYVDRKLEGSMKAYYSSGKLKAEANYLHDEQDGLYKGYYENGQLEVEGMMVNGMKQGYWYYYDDQGNLTDKDYYLDNEKDGICYEYLPVTGKVISKTYFDMGFENRLIEMDTMGGVIQDLSIEPGKTYHLELHNFMGKKIREDQIKNNHLFGEEKQFYPDGKLASVLYRRQSQEDSVFKAYYHDGTLKRQGWFENGERHGRWVMYNRDGEVDYIEHYDQGKLHGRDTFFSCMNTLEAISPKYYGERHGWSEKYAPNGDLLYKYHYIKDQMVGYTYMLPDGSLTKEIPVENSGKKEIIKTYYKNGKLSGELEYSNGEYNGKRILYYPDGKLWFQAVYKNGESDGEEMEFYPNGQLYASKMMKNGEGAGLHKLFTSTGKPISEDNYSNGYVHGTSKYYKKDGSLESTITYYWGTIVSIK